MRTNLIIAALVIACVIAATFLFDTSGPPESTTLQSTKSETKESASRKGPAPDFSAVTLDGKTVSLSALRGKPVLLNFWATWCAPCIVELPKLMQLSRDMDGKIVVLALSSDRNKESIEKFLARLPQETEEQTKSPNAIIAWDEGARITSDLYQTIKLPETILISPDGRMMDKIVGDTDWLGEDMKSRLTALASPVAAE
jgi:thiol-disulfide isomerase/thioredoxin